MKQIYLHIGTPKTGTTALQQFLRNNDAALEAAGLLVPRAGWVNNAHYQYSQAVGASSNGIPALGVDPDALRKRFFAEAAASAAPKIIISSEFFAAAQNMRPIVDFFTEPGFEVKVVIYLRRHDYLFESLFAQHERMAMVKNPQWDFDINAFTLFQFCAAPQLYDFGAMVERWAGAFGKGNMIVRPYESSQNKPDLFHDVLTAMDVADSENFKRPAQVNAAFGQETMLAARQIRLAGLPDAATKKAVKAVFDTDTSERGQRYFSPAQRHVVYQRYAQSYRRIAQAFLGRPDLFLDAAPKPTDKPAQAGAPDMALVMEKLRVAMAALG